MPKEVSRVVPTAPSRGAQKLGHPVPLSNLVAELNRSRSQPAQVKVPRRSSCSSGLVNGRSVSASRSTEYWTGVRRLRHSASLYVTSNVSATPGSAEYHDAPYAAARPAAQPSNTRRLPTMIHYPSFGTFVR